MAQEIARFPQGCVRADRRSAYLLQGLSVRDALEREWGNSNLLDHLRGFTSVAVKCLRGD
jgi:hypothetical protein